MSKRALLRLVTSICFMVNVMFLGQISAYADEIKPVHEYNFDNDKDGIVYDSINEGAINSSVKRDDFVPGYNGKGRARSFNDDSNNTIQFPVSPLPKGAKSIRFKMKKEASTISYTSDFIMSSYDPVKKQPLFWISITGSYAKEAAGYLTFFIPGTGGLKSPTNICDGKWHDILYTWDGTSNSNSAKLYIDDMTVPVATQGQKEDIDSKLFYIGECPGFTNGSEYFTGDLDDILIYNTPITPKSSNLKAIGGDSKVDLTWNAVTDATSYAVKRSTTAGGPYTTIATNITETSYTDTDVTSGTTYYYIVSATINGTEISDSNEASATPEASQTPPTTEAKLKVVLEVAESLRLSVDDDLNVNTQMSWSSSAPTVATVNEKGIVTALAPGNTVITVKSVDGSYTDYINVLVVENADDYRLAIDLKVGETARLTADDFTNTANITWAPMDSSIANVTSKGKVTALSKGLVLISAKDAEGNIIGRVYVRVRE